MRRILWSWAGLSVLWLGAARAETVGGLVLTLSSLDPCEGDAVVATVQVPGAAAGLTVALYLAEGPQHGTALERPQMVVQGVTDASGTFRFEEVIGPGLAGRRFGIQAYALDGDVLMESPVRELLVTPAAAEADWICTPTTVTRVATGEQWTKDKSVEFAYGQSVPGDVILLEAGDYKKFEINKAWQDGQALTWIKARTPGTARILRHSVGGSATLDLKKAGYVVFQGLDIKPSDQAAVLCAQNLTIPQITFVNCTVSGDWDWISRTGARAKWGVLGWQLSGFTWLGGRIENLSDEHAFYLHNCEGDVTIADVRVSRLGRTLVQIVARSTESKGNEGRGRITVRNVEASDCCLEGNASGGSALTFAGRHRDPILVTDTVIRAGFDAALNDAFGKVTATGAFVSHFGGGSDQVPNGPITLHRCVLEIAPGGGDRTHLSVAATDAFTLKACTVTAGRRYALEGYAGSVGRVVLDRASTVTSGATNDCKWGGKNYPTYEALLDALGF